MANDDYGIGSTLVTVVTLKSLGIPNPKFSYRGGVSRRELHSGLARELGSPLLNWHWDFFDPDWRPILVPYVTMTSKALFIESRISDLTDDGFHVFSCIGYWPEEEKLDSFHRMDFNLLFKFLVES